MTSLDGVVTITNLYTDPNTNEVKTDVYSNGKMQVLVYPTVNYSGSASLEKVKAYVANKTNIYFLDTDGNKVALDTSKWIKSDTSNGYLHDINRSHVHKAAENAATSDIRVALYFVVPLHLAGEYKWIAELDGIYTSTVDPVLVNIHNLSVAEYDFEIDTIQESGEAKLKALIYTSKSLPSNHQLVKPLKYKGLNFKRSGKDGNCWITVLQNVDEKNQHTCGAFLVYKLNSVWLADKSKTYNPSEYSLVGSDFPAGRNMSTDGGNWNAPEQFSKDDIDAAWSKGIVMVSVPYIKVLPDPNFPNSPLFLESQGIGVEDNFGNSLTLDFNWDFEDNVEKWAVSSATVNN